jgi:hypothetical protein
MAQLDLFGSSRLASSVPREPDREKIRMLLSTAIEQLRTADEMPWRPAELRSWHHVFQNMTKWLPAEERAEFREAFDIEISRLRSI